jgi:hypothetical protein
MENKVSQSLLNNLKYYLAFVFLSNDERSRLSEKRQFN